MATGQYHSKQKRIVTLKAIEMQKKRRLRSGVCSSGYAVDTDKLKMAQEHYSNCDPN